MSLILKLYFEFFKIGLFAVGGGAATIPFLSTLSETTGWFTKIDLANMIAISESTPGAIGVNMSTYVGFMTGETVGVPVLGCIIASLGLITPSVIIILIISGILNKFKENTVVKNMFYGLRPASAGLIGAAAFEIIKISLIHIDRFIDTGSVLGIFDIKTILLFLILFFSVKKSKLHPIIFIVISAIAGMLLEF